MSLLKDRTISNRVKAHLAERIAEAQTAFESGKVTISDSYDREAEEAYAEYEKKIEALDEQREKDLKSLEDRLVHGLVGKS